MPPLVYKIILPLFIVIGASCLFFIFHKGTFNMTSPSLIPRKIFFGNPDKTQVRISHDGRYLTYVGPHEDVLNLWLQPADQSKPAEPLTHDKGRGIQGYVWTYDNKHILYIQDQEGDENWKLFKINIETKKITTLLDKKNVQMRFIGSSYKHPSSILIGINDRVPQYHDIYLLDIETGSKKKIYENNSFVGFLIDDDLKIRLACKFTEDGGADWLKIKGKTEELYESFNSQDNATSGPVGFSKEGDSIYWFDSRNRDLAALTLSHFETKKTKVIARPKKTDFSDVAFHPTENTPLWLEEEYLKPEKSLLDSSYEKDFSYLKKLHKGLPTLVCSTLDFQKWVVAYSDDRGPVSYYLYNRSLKTSQYLFSNNKSLENLNLSPMHSLEIKARDGLNLVSYLTLPAGLTQKSAKKLPTILLVHGGPESRDAWGYNSQHQWLANRGYGVLSVNYRGSSGFGKRFVTAGDKEWARKMHDDLIDAVDYLVSQGISDPEKIAIMGGSYGGYATLVGLTKTPDTFSCGVSIVGPSNLLTLIKSVPVYWKPILGSLKRKIGDPDTKEGLKLLKERSPLTYVDCIKKPLLIGQGANDPRVKQAESDQIVEEMKKKNIPVTYALYPDEGHGFVKPANRISFFAITEKFLADHLGGHFEPVGSDLKGSSLKIKEGAVS
jgi:dipeptidyl aminopeptidase/acylaminoacyl peptidase